MLVSDLIEALEDYGDGQHVVITGEVTQDGNVGTWQKREILSVWSDSFGVVNIIAGESCDGVDANMRGECGYGPELSKEAAGQ